MMDTASVSSAVAATSTQYQATIQLLAKTLEMQTDLLNELLASMGIGTQVNVQA